MLSRRNKILILLMYFLVLTIPLVSAFCFWPFCDQTDIILIDRTVDTNGVNGEMTAFLLGSQFVNPFDSNVIDGNIVAGSFFNLFVTDNDPLVVSETGMFKIDMNFNNLTRAPQRVDMFANYDGSPAHRKKIMMFDFDTNTYIDLTSDADDFPDDPTGTITRFTFDANSTMGNFMDDSGKAGVRIELVMGVPNPDHNFSIDSIIVEDGAINFTTLGTFEKLTGVDEGLSRNIDVNGDGGTFTILEQGRYKLSYFINWQGPVDTAFIMALFKNDIRQDNFFTTNSIDSNIEDVVNNSVSGFLDLNVGDVVDFRVASQPGAFLTIFGYNFNIIKLTGDIPSSPNLWRTFQADVNSATANTPTDIFSILGGTGGISTRIVGDSLFIDSSGSAGAFYFAGASLTLSDGNFFNVNDTNLFNVLDFTKSTIFNSAFGSDFNVNNVTRLLQDSNCDNNTQCTFTGDFNGLVPAFNVTSDGNSTFGDGNYVFPNDVNVVLDINVGRQLRVNDKSFFDANINLSNSDFVVVGGNFDLTGRSGEQVRVVINTFASGGNAQLQFKEAGTSRWSVGLIGNLDTLEFRNELNGAAMIFTQDRKVSIGPSATSSPEALLHIKGGNNVLGNAALVMERTASVSNKWFALIAPNPPAVFGAVTSLADGSLTFISRTVAADFAILGTTGDSDVPTFVHKSTGFTGILTTDPTHALNVVGDLNITGPGTSEIRDNTNTSDPILTFIRSPSAGTPAIVRIESTRNGGGNNTILDLRLASTTSREATVRSSSSSGTRWEWGDVTDTWLVRENGSSTRFSIATGGTATFANDVIVSGSNFDVANLIRHDGDTDTDIAFTDDKITFNAGGVEFVTFSEAILDITTFNTIVGFGGSIVTFFNTDGNLTVDAPSGTGSGSVFIDGSAGGCLKIRDTDDMGTTYCTALNGTLTCNMTVC